MKDGYYLSAYLHIDKLSYLLGIGGRHDQSIALFLKESNNIKLVHYWELERLTGSKMHSRAFIDTDRVLEIIGSLLATKGLTINDIVEIWGTPGLQTNNHYHSIDDYPQLAYHGISHLFSSIMSDSDIFYNEKIIGLAIDGGPDAVVDCHERSSKYYYVGCYVDKGKMKLLPVFSPGLLWFLAKKKYKLREGTLMALASASKSQLYLEDNDIILISDKNSYSNGLDYFEKLSKIADNLKNSDEGKVFNGYDSNFSIEENKISMVIKEIQKMSIRIMENNIDMIADKFDIKPEETFLALSGGYALNCPTNSYLMSKYKFKGFMAPPCVSDCGLALGMGLYGFYRKMFSQKMCFNLGSAFYGNKDENLYSLLEKSIFKQFVKSITCLNLRQVVNDIKLAPIVWFNGSAEIGPRALGNRSILADPRTEQSKNVLNQIKQREWWRPVAPIVLEEDVDDWFENAYSSPYMLHTFKIKEDRLKMIPAVAHLDNTARVQTINSENNYLLYSIIDCFKRYTGIPIICNTSLNDKGEPIIDNIEQALNFALRKDINIVYINGMRVELYNHNEYKEKNPLLRPLSVDTYNEDEINASWKDVNPYNIPKDILQLYKTRMELVFEKSYDITSESHANKLISDVELMRKLKNVSRLNDYTFDD